MHQSNEHQAKQFLLDQAKVLIDMFTMIVFLGAIAAYCIGLR